ncbi:MAG: hypothetical protein WCJ33_04570 [Pseudomonadota bacterium]
MPFCADEEKLWIYSIEGDISNLLDIFGQQKEHNLLVIPESEINKSLANRKRKRNYGVTNSGFYNFLDLLSDKNFQSKINGLYLNNIFIKFNHGIQIKNCVLNDMFGKTTGGLTCLVFLKVCN